MERSKIELMRDLEAHADIQSELQEINQIASWVERNFFDREAIPLIDEGERIDLRRTLLDGLLIRYRRCFHSGMRGSIDMVRGRAAIGAWIEIHDDELMFRANKVVAHAVSAAASTQIHITDTSEVSWSTQRPGVNQFDFKNLAKLSEEWLAFVGIEINSIVQELKPRLTQEDAGSSTIIIAPFTAGLDIQAVRAGRGLR